MNFEELAAAFFGGFLACAIAATICLEMLGSPTAFISCVVVSVACALPFLGMVIAERKL